MHGLSFARPIVIGCLGILSAGLTPAQGTLTIVTSSLPPASTGVQYSATLQATGGAGGYSWSVSGSLPAGLSLNSSSGAITGVPTTQVIYPAFVSRQPVFVSRQATAASGLVFQVQDSAGATATANLTINVASPVTLGSGTPPSGTLGSPYSFCVSAQGGDLAAGWTWALAGGSLPSGINLIPGGGGACTMIPGSQVVGIAGTPAQAGTFPFTLQVSDPDGRTAQQSFILTISSGNNPGATLTLTVTPGSLTFTAPGGGAAPSPQSLQVGVSSGSLGFSAAVTQGASWLSVSPSAGTTPGALSVTATPGNLAPGQYPGTIQIMATGVSNSPQSVAVSLTVPTPTPAVVKVESAASYQGSALAPGSLVTIMGTGLGPAVGVSMTPSSNGIFGTMLSGTQVLFNGIAAPLLYASSGQINAILPFAAAGQATISVQVTYNGLTSSSLTVPIAPAAPALFTVSASGTGPGAILNQDLSPNSATNPATAGSAVVLYGSGGGQFQPPLPDGEVTGANLSDVVLPVTAQVGGVNAKVLYAGSAPGLVAGAMQVNVQIPAGTPSGNVKITITINGVASQAGVTVAVR